MPRTDTGCGGDVVRRLRESCAVALASVAVGIATTGIAAFSGVAAADPAAAQERTAVRAAIDFHVTVTSGTITGSGFQIADGLAVTNAHVLGSAGPGADIRLVYRAGRETRNARGRVLAISQRMDLAVVALAPGLMPVVSSLDAPLDPGRTIRAAGIVAQPSGSGPRLELEGRIASGPMSLPPFGPGRIALMPGIRRGFSGGPVLDADGRLVGMVAALRAGPDDLRRAGGDPLEGREAYILDAAAVRSEVARLLAGRSILQVSAR